MDSSSERLEVFDGNDYLQGLFLPFHCDRLQHSGRIVMVSTDRTLLRLHVEAVWGGRLPPVVENDGELLPESAPPPWKLWAGDITGGRDYIWRSDFNASGTEAPPLVANEGWGLTPRATP